MDGNLGLGFGTHTPIEAMGAREFGTDDDLERRLAAFGEKAGQFGIEGFGLSTTAARWVTARLSSSARGSGTVGASSSGAWRL